MRIQVISGLPVWKNEMESVLTDAGHDVTDENPDWALVDYLDLDQVPTSRFVVVDGLPSVEACCQAFRAGAADYLVRPHTREQLLAIIKALEA